MIPNSQLIKYQRMKFKRKKINNKKESTHKICDLSSEIVIMR